LENGLVIQLGGILLTLIVALLGIFKGLLPKLIESTEKRLVDKDKFLESQTQALDDVCRERREQTENFLKSLNSVVMNNATTMKSLTDAIENFEKKMADDHSVQHQNHTEILDLLRDKKKPATRRKTAKKAAAKK